MRGEFLKGYRTFIVYVVGVILSTLITLYCLYISKSDASQANTILTTWGLIYNALSLIILGKNHVAHLSSVNKEKLNGKN